MESPSSPKVKKQPFGRRKDIHRIILAKGDSVTSVTIHPAVAFVTVLGIAALGLAYLAATGYLIFRDDLINASVVRQAKLQHAYEDRIAVLRTEIDRIASRQMLDQRSVENKLDRLLGLQDSVTKRGDVVKALASSASTFGLVIPQSAPLPRPRPTASSDHASISSEPGTSRSIQASYASEDTSASSAFSLALDPKSITGSTSLSADRASAIDFDQLERQIADRDRKQLATLQWMTKQASQSATRLSSTIRALGFKPSKGPTPSEAGVGGPFEELSAFDSIAFDQSVLALEETLNHLNRLKRQVAVFPLRKPMKVGTRSSAFGRRLDPFLKRYAMHSGVDFRAPKGSGVYATAPGKVVKAGWHGGYGRLVEIEHANGLTTRYAHLSKMRVSAGVHVSAGQRIGDVGSSGRSTGPHLHYETRVSGQAVNPSKFLKAGSKVADLL